MSTPRAIPFDELDLLPTDKADQLDRIFNEIEQRRNPQHGPGPDELASDLWELARMRDQYRS